MNDTIWILIALLAGIVLGGVACHLVMSARGEARTARAEATRDAAIEQTAELRREREAMLASYRSLSDEALDRQTKTIESVATQRLQATQQLMSPVQNSLDKLDIRLTEIEKDRVRLSTELAGHIQSVQRSSEQLKLQTSSLVTALRKPQVRGTWGEIHLKQVVELAGMVEHCDFMTQASTTRDEAVIRPDLKVNLTGGKFVYVDAKTPLEAFLSAQETDSETERAQHLATFARHVRTHVDQLASKAYWKADSATPEFVILFLPLDSLFTAALEHDPELVEHAAQKNVMLTTPTTLITALRAIAYAWTQQTLADSAKEISDLGRELYERLGKMGSHFDRLGRSLDASVRSYNEAIGSLESRVFVSARRFRDLKVSDDSMEALTPVTNGPRVLSAPELVTTADELPVRDPLNTRQALENPESGESVILATKVGSR
ncbi:MAG: DNA recombination protein RmuC [Propionibacteriaceae bacterium]|nr:DNA recombination protein RmuC [Propionibacteriaceae bacterium]